MRADKLRKRVVILNGPPDSGKDTLAEYCSQQSHTRYAKRTGVRRFKEELYRVAATLYCVDYEWLEAIANDRGQKEQTQPELGCSPREALIYTSEQVVKPHFGDEWFGKKAAASLDEGHIHYFSDGGFEAEMNPLLAEVGQANFLLVRLCREGRTFAGDSRRYIDEDLADNFYELNNTGTIDAVGDQLLGRVNSWIEETSDHF